MIKATNKNIYKVETQKKTYYTTEPIHDIITGLNAFNGRQSEKPWSVSKVSAPAKIRENKNYLEYDYFSSGGGFYHSYIMTQNEKGKILFVVSNDTPLILQAYRVNPKYADPLLSLFDDSQILLDIDTENEPLTRQERRIYETLIKLLSE